MFREEVEDAVFTAYDALEDPDGASLWLYDPDQIAALPDGARRWALGVGNPVRHADLRPGDQVLDVGCGAGIDVLLAAREVGPEGRVVGVDGLPAMVERAGRFAADAGVDNATFVEGRIDALPLEDASVDVVVSNGAINLAARKSRVFAEILRVLRPGGRLCVADLTIVEEDLPVEVLTHPSAWAG